MQNVRAAFCPARADVQSLPTRTTPIPLSTRPALEHDALASPSARPTTSLPMTLATTNTPYEDLQALAQGSRLNARCPLPCPGSPPGAPDLHTDVKTVFNMEPYASAPQGATVQTALEELQRMGRTYTYQQVNTVGAGRVGPGGWVGVGREQRRAGQMKAAQVRTGGCAGAEVCSTAKRGGLPSAEADGTAGNGGGFMPL